MRLIIDANILFAALIKESTVRWLIFHLDVELIAPEFILEEIEKHKEEILRKSKLDEKTFVSVLQKIKEKIVFLSDEVTVMKLEEAFSFMKDIDKNDCIFLAAALATNSGIWSDDAHFKKQTKVKVWTTKELVPYI